MLRGTGEKTQRRNDSSMKKIKIKTNKSLRRIINRLPSRNFMKTGEHPLLDTKLSKKPGRIWGPNGHSNFLITEKVMHNKESFWFFYFLKIFFIWGTPRWLSQLSV